MKKRILKITGITLLVLALLAATVPFLVPAEPEPNLPSAKEVALPDSQFVTIPFAGTEGIEIHYLEQQPEAEGETTFVLLHGSFLNALTWNNVMDSLSAFGRVVAYDQVPYGLSEKLLSNDWSDRNPYTPEAAVEQLFSFIDSLDISGRVVLVGSSYGGRLAALAALAKPEIVDSLILVGPAVYTIEEMPGWLLRLPQVRHLGPLLARTLAQNESFKRMMYTAPDTMVSERAPLTNMNHWVSNWDAALWEYLLAWSVPDISSELTDVAQLTLIIQGEEDAIVPVSDSEQLNQAISNSELHIVPSCGHLPQEECPDDFNRIVSEWLQRRDE